jgi:hypothetical protein
MSRSTAFVPAVVLSLLVPLGLAAGSPGAASAAPAAQPATPELSTTTRLADRRSLAIGDRFYEVGAEDGTYPATGWHTRGEMGGFWTPPIKLLDGLWFKAGGQWLKANKYTSGFGYSKMDLGSADGVSITRTDFAPDGIRAGLVGLRLDSPTATSLDLTVDAHSELMKAYPWGETKPSQTTYNLPDKGTYTGGDLVFRETGTPPVANAERHDYAALVGSTLQPTGHALGPDFRGPQDPATICPASGPNTPPPPDRCDDTAYGKGTGGQLTYKVPVPAGGTTVWFAVAGSDDGLKPARAELAKALARPDDLLSAKSAARQTINAQTNVSLPGDPMLQSSVAWSKQDLADSVQQADNMQIRVSHAGVDYPAPAGTVAKARWIGAGWPDYPWLFATDGEYTAFAAVAAGQFQAVEDHLRALKDVSEVANGDSGKLVHEVTPDGQVYFGSNGDAGNTDETAKFPSAVALVWRWTGDNAFRDEMYPFAVKNMHYIYDHLDADGDGWPEGLGNVERPGMGDEKLDNTVYTIRGLSDLADLAASKGDSATEEWASNKANDLEQRFEQAWWFGPSADQYADSLSDPGNQQVFQRHWIGLTPVEAELTHPGQPAEPLASLEHATLDVAKREGPCYTGANGMFHTGTGATTADGGNPGATCDTATSSVGSERSIFTINTSIMAVAEGALGRMGANQLQQYTDDNARQQVDPSQWELPGAMPEISPSPDFKANIDQRFTDRSMALQAWGTYGILWPVVHYELGVAPDVGRGAVSVVPQVPDGQKTVSGNDVRLGQGSVDVAASSTSKQLKTTVDRHLSLNLTIGAVLPTGASVSGVKLDGSTAKYRVVSTDRGREVLVNAGKGVGTSTLVVSLG